MRTALNDPPYVATAASFYGSELINRETKFLAMPHFLRTFMEMHTDMARDTAQGWAVRARTETDDGGQHFLVIESGPLVTLIWFDLAYQTIYERSA